jgi:hypothetical protein
MKKVININFQGRVVPIEESAYDILKQYVESLRRFFANEEGRDEIINDIEDRIAELFTETLKKGSSCITDEEVNVIIASIGRPEDFEAEEASVKSQLSGESTQQDQYQSAGAETQRGRLYRDETDKICITGTYLICHHHFWWVRCRYSYLYIIMDHTPKPFFRQRRDKKKIIPQPGR